MNKINIILGMLLLFAVDYVYSCDTEVLTYEIEVIGSGL